MTRLRGGRDRRARAAPRAPRLAAAGARSRPGPSAPAGARRRRARAGSRRCRASRDSERRPLWPPCPPPRFTRTLPRAGRGRRGRRSARRRATSYSSTSRFTDLPETFMNVCGLASTRSSSPKRTTATFAPASSFQYVARRFSPSRSTARKPGVVPRELVLGPGIAEPDDESRHASALLLFLGFSPMTSGSASSPRPLPRPRRVGGVHGARRSPRVVEDRDALGRDEVGDVQAVADLERGDVDLDVLGQVGRQGLDVELVKLCVSTPPAFTPGGVADEVERHDGVDRSGSCSTAQKSTCRMVPLTGLVLHLLDRWR